MILSNAEAERMCSNAEQPLLAQIAALTSERDALKAELEAERKDLNTLLSMRSNGREQLEEILHENRSLTKDRDRLRDALVKLNQLYRDGFDEPGIEPEWLREALHPSRA